MWMILRSVYNVGEVRNGFCDEHLPPPPPPPHPHPRPTLTQRMLTYTSVSCARTADLFSTLIFTVLGKSYWNIKLKQWEMRRVPFTHPNQMQSLSDFKIRWFLIRSGICPHAKKTTLMFAHQCVWVFFLSQDVFWKNDNKTDSLCCTFNSSTLCTKYERC